MYCDKDNTGHFSIMELTPEEFETVRLALAVYRETVRQRLVYSQNRSMYDRFTRAGTLLRLAEIVK